MTISSVLIVAPEIRGGHGGIQTYGAALLQVLSALPEFEVHLVVKNDREVHYQTTESFEVRATGDYSPTIRTGAFCQQVFASAKEAHPDFIIMLHAHFLPMASVLRNFFGSRCIVTGYGIEVWRPPSALQALGASYIDATAFISRFTQNKSWEAGWNWGWRSSSGIREAIIPCPFLEVSFERDLTSVGALEVDQSLSPLVLTVSRLSEADTYKGIDRLLGAAQQLLASNQPIRLAIVGDGDDRERLEALTRSYGIEESVEFLGSVSDEELSSLYQRADCFCLPSEGEGLGIAAIEALAHGCPIVVGDSDGAQEVLLSAECGLAVDVHSQAELAAALVKVTTSFGVGSQRIHRQQLAQKEFGLAAFAERWLTLLGLVQFQAPQLTEEEALCVV